MVPGALIGGKYRLTRKLGDGTMGVVWAAVNESTQREVALKLIQQSSPELRGRLLREARACGSLVHRHIVEVYDVGQTEDGDPFLVMQRLEGETLGERIKRTGRLDPTEAAAVAVAIARALRVAHDAGIIHRDLKPANVFLHREPDVPGEVVKVLDFGVSKVLAADQAGSTATGSLIGSPAYMSPEQARASKDIDHRADLWSLGVMLFEMLTGRRPFPSHAVFAVLAEVLTGPIPKVLSVMPSAGPGLSRVVDRCLERDVERRVSSAGELIQLLTPFAGDLVTTRDGAPSPLSSRERNADAHTDVIDVASLRGARLPVAQVRDDDEDFLPTTNLDVKQLALPAHATVTLLAPAPAPPPSSPGSPGPPASAPGVHPPPAMASSSTSPLMYTPGPPIVPVVSPARDPRRTLLVAVSMAALAALLVVLGMGIGGALSARPSAPAPVPAAVDGGGAAPSPPAASASVTAAPTAGPVPPDPAGQAASAAPDHAALGTPMGTLDINSSPVSSVSIDGKPIGSTPKMGYRVSAGLHRVTFVHPRLGRMQVLADVKAGQSSTAAVKFEERPIGGSVQSPGF